MRDYKYYLFDADGTLIDTTELICRCFENTARMTGNAAISKDEVLGHIGLTLRDQMAVHFKKKLDDAEFERYRSIHMDYQMSVYKEYLKLFFDVKETLEILKSRGKKLAIVTSRFRNSLDIYLQDTGIFQYFDTLVSPEATIHHKPHPEPVLKALELLGGDASDALYVGDATFDIEAGFNAGVDTAFVNWSINSVSTLKAAPTWTIDSMKELLA